MGLSLREEVARKLNPWAFGIVANIQHTERAALEREAAFALADDAIAIAAEATEAQDRRIAELEAERDEVREIALIYAKHWPYGQRVSRDEELRNALCDVPSPQVRALLPTDTKEPSDDR